MKLRTALQGGLIGALALTAVHEIVRRLDEDAPRMDELGMEALASGLARTGCDVPDRKALFGWTLFGDVLSNALYYSMAGLGGRKGLLAKGAALGLLGGIGGVVLPGPMGLNPAPSNRTKKTKLLTVAWYLIGGLVAAGAMQLFEEKEPPLSPLPTANC